MADPGVVRPGAGVQVLWQPELTTYDFGPSHPMAPLRLELTHQLARDLGILQAPGVEVVTAKPADDSSLHHVHGAGYVEAVRRASVPPYVAEAAYGLGTPDVPVFPGMHEASALIAAGTRDVALAVWQGRAAHGVNFAGGLHHAMPNLASGFCVYNDIGVAIAELLEAGAERIAYVDVDVHHGDGVERIFVDDPRVMTISLHESGQFLFPGTGFARDTGGPHAEGTAVNVALPPGTTDADWLRAFDAIVPSLVRAFEPQILITQQGCDSHVLDPLAHLSLSVDAQRQSYQWLHELAHEVCEGRWVAVGGGGYAVVDVVPRAWTHLLAVAAHADLDPATPTPESWREYVRERTGLDAPKAMTDGAETVFTPWLRGHDPQSPLDRAVMATRRAVFPLHGLDPWMD